MNLLRVSIGRLMIVIVFIAIASVAMLRPSRLTASLTFAGTFLLLTLTTLALVVDRKRFRGFAEGFAIGGWLFFAVHFCSFFSISSPNTFNVETDPPMLPSTMLLDLLFPRIIKDSYQPMPVPFVMPKGAPPAPPVPPSGGASLPPPVPPPPITGSITGTITVSGPGVLYMPPPAVSTSNEFWFEIDRGIVPMVPARSPSFMTIGFCIFTLLLATMCGGVTSWLQSRQESGPSLA